MKIFLALVILLNSFTVFARGSGGEVCDTPVELMAGNHNAKDFTRICKSIIAQDEGCKKLKPEKRMSCNAKKENQILSSSDLLAKAGQCAKGFLWDSMYELGKFILDLIKMLVGASVNSVTSMIKFLSDSEYREKAIASAKGGSKLGMAFLNSAGLYFAREFPKNLKKNPLNPLAAVGETLLGPLVKMITEGVQSIAAHYIPQYQCMNGTAKLYTICRVLGDFIMPPVFIFTFLKTGIKGLQALKGGAEASKISKVQKKFAEANELSAAAKAAAAKADVPKPKPSRITVDQSPGSPARKKPKPSSAPEKKTPPPVVVHGEKPKPAEPLTKPIEEHNADELIEIGRSEATAESLNAAELARLEAQSAKLVDEAVAPPPATVAAVELTDDNIQAIMIGYKTDPEYGKLFSQKIDNYDEFHQELTTVIHHLEKTNPGMSKAQIREKITKGLESCPL